MGSILNYETYNARLTYTRHLRETIGKMLERLDRIKDFETWNAHAGHVAKWMDVLRMHEKWLEIAEQTGTQYLLVDQLLRQNRKDAS